MHIYPAQKRWLGRRLVSLAQAQQKQVFVVTHDPIVLQGILDTPATTRIFRIDMDSEGHRLIKRCDLRHVTDVGAKRNQDSYLQGLFYQRCIGVEGAADRAFYQNIVEELFQTRIEDKDDEETTYLNFTENCCGIDRIWGEKGYSLCTVQKMLQLAKEKGQVTLGEMSSFYNPYPNNFEELWNISIKGKTFFENHVINLEARKNPRSNEIYYKYEEDHS